MIRPFLCLKPRAHAMSDPNRHSIPVLPSPFPRQLKIPLPNSNLGGSCLALSFRICSMAISRPIESPAVTNKPVCHIFTRDRADGYNSPIAVPFSLSAINSAPADPIRKGQRCALTTTPRLALDVAKLRAFWCIDAPNADTLVVNFYGVTIDH